MMIASLYALQRSVDSVPESREERTRAALDGSAVGGGHLAPPSADPVPLQRLREVLLDSRAVLARHPAPADVQPCLQSRDDAFLDELSKPLLGEPFYRHAAIDIAIERG